MFGAMSKEKDDLAHLTDKQRAELAELEATNKRALEAKRAEKDDAERVEHERNKQRRSKREQRARELDELAGDCALYVTPDDLEVAITVDAEAEEVWYKLGDAPARLCWRGFTATKVAIQNAAGDVVGHLEARA
jgi:hypothetical protein